MRKKIFTLVGALLLTGSMARAQQDATSDAVALDRAGWTIGVSGWCSDNGSGNPESMTDGNLETFWHSNWAGDNGTGDASGSVPQWITVDLGVSAALTAIGYTPRSFTADAANLPNGTMTEYKIVVKDTPFGTLTQSNVSGLENPTATGTLTYDNGSEEKQIALPDGTKGRYVLIAVTASGGSEANQWASCAELNIYAGAVNAAKYNLAYRSGVVASWAGTAPGFKPEADITAAVSAANTVLEKADATAEEVTAALATLNSAFDGIATIQPEDGYYQIISAFGNFEAQQGVKKAIYADGDNLKWGNQSADAVAQIWELKATDAGYTLRNVGQDTYLAASLALGATPGDVTLVVTNPGIFNIAVDGSAPLHTGGHNGGAGVSGDVVAYGTMGSEKTGGSVWTLVSATLPADVSTILAPARAALEAAESNTGSSVGNYDATQIAALRTKLDATPSDVDAAIALNREVLEGVAAALNLPQAGKYYRLSSKSDATKFVGTTGTKAYAVQDADKTRTDVLWQFVPIEDGYKLKNANLGAHLNAIATGGGNPATDITSDETNGGLYTLSFPSNNTEALLQNGTADTHFLQIDGTNQALNGWTDADHARWYIVEATDINVALTTVGDQAYATAYMPFAVKAANATVYTGAISADSKALNLTATTDAVPAQTGVILEGAANQATAQLTIEAAAGTMTSALSGSLTAVTLDDAARANYLVLGVSNDADAALGFFKPSASVTEIAANKAFLTASAGVNAVKVNFGELTGITSAAAGTSAAAVYDLSGRRVSAASQKGVYIQGGRKYIVK